MDKQNPIDRVAFVIACLTTFGVAMVVGWCYGLDWATVSNHLLFYVSLFAMASGFPSYYLVRLIALSKARSYANKGTEVIKWR